MTEGKRIAGASPFLKRFRDGPLLIYLRQVFTRIFYIIRKSCFGPWPDGIESLEATFFFLNVRVSTARLLHSVQRLFVHFSCHWQMEKVLKFFNCFTNVRVSWCIGWWYVVELRQIFLQQSKGKIKVLKYKISRNYNVCRARFFGKWKVEKWCVTL